LATAAAPAYCRRNQENLCDSPLFTGYTRDGGFATAAIADAAYAFPLGEAGSDEAMAPLLCAGLIGWRSLVMAGEGRTLGLYGFGAAGHIVAQIARFQGRSVFACTKPGARRAPRRHIRRGCGSCAVNDFYGLGSRLTVQAVAQRLNRHDRTEAAGLGPRGV